MNLLEYINSDEYKNEESVYMTPEEFSAAYPWNQQAEFTNLKMVL